MGDDLQNAVIAALTDGKLTCAAAFVVSVGLGVEPGAVGQAADDMDIRVSRCQLGLFGYGDKALGQHRIVTPMHAVPPGLEAALRAAAPGGRLTCADAWRVAETLGLARLSVSSAAETLGLKMVRCQLGCF